MFFRSTVIPNRAIWVASLSIGGYALPGLVRGCCGKRDLAGASRTCRSACLSPYRDGLSTIEIGFPCRAWGVELRLSVAGTCRPSVGDSTPYLLPVPRRGRLCASVCSCPPRRGATGCGNSRGLPGDHRSAMPGTCGLGRRKRNLAARGKESAWVRPRQISIGDIRKIDIWNGDKTGAHSSVR